MVDPPGGPSQAGSKKTHTLQGVAGGRPLVASRKTGSVESPSCGALFGDAGWAQATDNSFDYSEVEVI